MITQRTSSCAYLFADVGCLNNLGLYLAHQALELLLGTPNIFSVDQRTTALLTNRLTKGGASKLDIQRALYLAALSQFCIYVPTVDGLNWPLRRGDPLYDVNVVKEKCTLKVRISAIQNLFFSLRIEYMYHPFAGFS